jgi:hypothetical protein
MIVGETRVPSISTSTQPKEKRLTNMPSSTAIECVKVTPIFIRLRKVELSAQTRQSAASKKARGLGTV